MFKCYLKECKTRASQTYKVNEIAKIYKFPNPTTDPVTISVVSFGGGLFGTVSPSGVLTGSDMEAYWTSIGIPLSNQPKVIIIPVDGAVNTPVADQGETQENTLDITMIGGCCPTSKLTILFFLAPNSLAGFPNLITKAVTPITIDGVLYTPSVVSISWGAPEINYSSTLLTTIDGVLKTATQSGINICVASGDNGSSDGVPGTLSYVDFPSSSPYVTACGGTTLLCPSLTYSDSTTVETVWSGSGGGVSGTFLKPTWQIPIVGATGSYRCSPDIALVADPSTGVEFLIGGKKSIFGGTSIVAPAMSAYYACLNTKRFLSPSIYAAAVAVPTAFHDITVGSNGAYSAKPGFDFCTGFGSIAGDILAAQLVSAPPPITVPVSGISLDTQSATLAVGNQMRVVAVITPANATNKGVLWESSGPGATVVGIACPNITMSVCECSSCECTKEVVPMISECDCVIPSYSSCDCKLKDPSIIACGCAGPSVIACGCAGPWRRRARSNARVSFSSCDCSNACECAQGGECNCAKPIISKCGCSSSCKCGCAQGGECTCTEPINRECGCNNSCTCGCVQGGECTCAKPRATSCDSVGLITAVSVGSVTITALSMDGDFVATTVITVIPAVPVTGISLNISVVMISVGSQYQLIATLSPSTATNKAILWSAAGTSATVSNTGLVKAIAIGLTTITAKSVDGGFTATATINVVAAPVVIPVTGISLDTSSVSLIIGTTKQLKATITPSNATNKAITWKSSSPAATVSNTGLVTAVSIGSATVTAKATDGGYTASALITVVSSIISIAFYYSSISMYTQTTYQSRIIINPSSQSGIKVTYASYTLTIVSVNASGLITALTPGRGLILASAGGKTAWLYVNVYLNTLSLLFRAVIPPTTTKSRTTNRYDIISRNGFTTMRR